MYNSVNQANHLISAIDTTANILDSFCMIKIFYDIFTYNKRYVAEYDKDFNYDKCIKYIDY